MACTHPRVFIEVGRDPSGNVLWVRCQSCRTIAWAKCDRPPRGWRCSRRPEHEGPCASRPAWWNVPALLRR